MKYKELIFHEPRPTSVPVLCSSCYSCGCHGDWNGIEYDGVAAHEVFKRLNDGSDFECLGLESFLEHQEDKRRLCMPCALAQNLVVKKE